MKKYLLLYAVAVTALFAFTYRRYHAENRRLVQNQSALAADVAHYRTRAGRRPSRHRSYGCGAESSRPCARPTPKRSAGWGSKSAAWRPPQKP